MVDTFIEAFPVTWYYSDGTIKYDSTLYLNVLAIPVGSYCNKMFPWTTCRNLYCRFTIKFSETFFFFTNIIFQYIHLLIPTHYSTKISIFPINCPGSSFTYFENIWLNSFWRKTPWYSFTISRFTQLFIRASTRGMVISFPSTMLTGSTWALFIQWNCAIPQGQFRPLTNSEFLHYLLDSRHYIPTPHLPPVNVCIW